MTIITMSSTELSTCSRHHINYDHVHCLLQDEVKEEIQLCDSCQPAEESASGDYLDTTAISEYDSQIQVRYSEGGVVLHVHLEYLTPVNT